MLPSLTDPIVAIATAPGRGAVGIVRASGRDLSAIAEAICGRALQPRVATFLPFRDRDGAQIDQGLAIRFPAPNSYTGEDVLELQAHGGPVVLQLLLARCLEAGAGIGMRLARPGEFTERAFHNDKLDLAQAEAVADLIAASTEAAARSAGRALTGAFSREIDGLAERIVELRVLVEATLDFPEEEIDFLRAADAAGRLAAIAEAVDAVRARARQGALLRDGLRVVIAGQPNVGKSSLLNALAGAERAIVTPIPGTTRDRIDETIQIEGIPIHIADTAGMRNLDDAGAAGDDIETAGADAPNSQLAIERIGIERSWSAIADADAVLFVHDLTRRGDSEYERAEAAIETRLAKVQDATVVDVDNKVDRCEREPANRASRAGKRSAIALSAKTGEGLDDLRRELLRLGGWSPAAEGVCTARTRHLDALARCAAHLAEAKFQAEQASFELHAEELRLAHDALGEITGAFTADDLLGAIFGRFCIGK